MKRWWLSDSHFGHLLAAEERGFGSVAEHDRVIIDNIKGLVGPKDMVFHLGDVGLASEEYIFSCLAQLPGKWLLIPGNHDKPWPGHKGAYRHQRTWLNHFASIQAFMTTRIGDYEVLMSHFPYEGDHTVKPRYQQFRLRDEGGLLLCGHTHKKERVHGPRQINLCLDAWELKPVSEPELLALIREM